MAIGKRRVINRLIWKKYWNYGAHRMPSCVSCQCGWMAPVKYTQRG